MIKTLGIAAAGMFIVWAIERGIPLMGLCLALVSIASAILSGISYEFREYRPEVDPWVDTEVLDEA